MSKLLLTSTLFFSLVIVQFHSAHARLNTITGGISVNYDYDETVYDTEYDTTDTTELTSTRDNSYLKKFSIAPLFIYEQKAVSITSLSVLIPVLAMIRRRARVTSIIIFGSQPFENSPIVYVLISVTVSFIQTTRSL